MRSPSDPFSRPPAGLQRGASLVELIVLIVVVGLVAATAMGALSTISGRSANPLVQRQALAAAQSLLDEILAQPTPDSDAALGPEGGEARGSASAPFDHVNDYQGFSMNGIKNFDGTPVAGLEGYAASVTVTRRAIGNVPQADGWWVEVTVTGPADTTVVLAGWRARLSG